MPKKLASGTGMLSIELEAGFADRHADGLRLDDGLRNSLRTGSCGVGGDQLEAVEQRQAGLDAAHDDVDGVREIVEEFRLAPLLEKRQHPERQAAARREAEAERRQQSQARCTIATTNAPTPSTAAVTMKRRFDQSSPACVSRTDSGGRLAFFRRSSISLSVPSTCSRRDFWRRRATAAPRSARSARRSPCAAPLSARRRGMDRRTPTPRRRSRPPPGRTDRRRSWLDLRA